MMTCPSCHAPLVIVDRHDVEIDYCPDCRGVWLDRGELDKIIARSGVSPSRELPREREPERRRYDDDRDHKPYKKKRENFLEELFDF